MLIPIPINYLISSCNVIKLLLCGHYEINFLSISDIIIKLLSFCFTIKFLISLKGLKDSQTMVLKLWWFVGLFSKIPQ